MAQSWGSDIVPVHLEMKNDDMDYTHIEDWTTIYISYNEFKDIHLG